MDFDQTCIVTLLGGGNRVLDFGDLDRINKFTQPLEMSDFDQTSVSA